MTRTSPEAPARSGFPSARCYLAVALGFVAFAIYGSLIPFEWRHLDPGVAWEQFGRTFQFSPTGRLSRSDVLANVLLFVPIGFSLAGARLVDRRGWMALLRTALLILPVSLAVSGAAEFLQMFTSDRIPSGLDIVAQTVGTVLGIAAWQVIGQEFTNWIRESLAAAPQDRASRVLVAAAAAWIFVNLVPFDITIDLGDLARRVETGRISLVPFGGDLSGSRRDWDIVAKAVGALPLGLLGVSVMYLRRMRVWPGAFLVGAGIVVSVECLQVFIRSHSADTGDALLGSLGVAAGIWIGTRVLPKPDGARAVVRSDGRSWRALGVVGIWCLVLAAYHWQPYDFTVDKEAIRAKVAQISILPFAGYLRGSYLNAFNDLLTKLALAVPFGVVASFVGGRNRVAFLSTTVLWLIVAMCVFGLLEGGQFFLPSRVPDPSDVLVGVTGAYAGLLLGRWAGRGRPGVTKDDRPA